MNWKGELGLCNHHWVILGDTVYMKNPFGSVITTPLALARCSKCGHEDFIRILLEDIPRVDTEGEYRKRHLFPKGSVGAQEREASPLDKRGGK